VHVIFADHPSYYPDLKSVARLSDQFPYPFPNIPPQYFLAIFRHPDKMILNLKYRMTPISVVHATSPFSQHILAAKADRLKPVVLTL
jgi:hypothetical protein